MAFAEMETPALAQVRRALAVIEQLQASAGLQQVEQFRHERGAVARVRLARALPVAAAADEMRVGEQQARRLAFFPGGEQAAGVVEVQVGEQHHVDVGVVQADRGEAVEQYVALFLDAVALAQGGREERADAGLHQYVALAVAHQQGTAAEVDAVLRIGLHPA